MTFEQFAYVKVGNKVRQDGDVSIVCIHKYM